MHVTKGCHVIVNVSSSVPIEIYSNILLRKYLVPVLVPVVIYQYLPTSSSALPLEREGGPTRGVM